MGGPMGVYDDAMYPFLRQEHDFLQRAIVQEVPLLGICLGSQLLAKALGACVYRNPQKEIGWYTVDLTAAGCTDPLFAGIDSPMRVFQWHGDAFELPAGATALASSPLCTHQAFRYGDRVYGLLFHLELTPEIIYSWLDTFRDELVSSSRTWSSTCGRRWLCSRARIVVGKGCHARLYGFGGWCNLHIGSAPKCLPESLGVRYLYAV
jgi:GMP synthase-like glutamine amidotransferase